MSAPPNHPWRSALVTGASSGIGRDLTRLLGAAGVPTVAVARRGDRLAELAAEHPSVEPLVADLGTPDGVDAVAARAGDVDLLVNNAGFGIDGDFADVAAEGHQRMIDLNVSALVALTRAAVEPMSARRRGWILQVSSMASFQPGPTAATYSATKAFVTSLTEALHEELRATGVIVTASCPGFTRTEFHEASGSADSVSSVPGFAWLSSQDVARSALWACAAGRALDIPGATYKGLAAVSGSMPRWAVRRLMALGSRTR
jgi:uncharacterized protein